jgi:DNA-binding beta-propeller fold protein YncE
MAAMATGRMKRIGLAALLAVLCLAAAGAARTQTDPVAAAPRVENPRRVAEGPNGQVLVTDRRHGAVVAVDRSSLEPVWSAPLPEEGAPFGLAVTKGEVFVGNTGTKNVEVYKIYGSGEPDTTLRFKHNLGKVPTGAIGPFENPIGIAVDANEKLVFVLDGAAKRIEAYKPNGSFQYAFEPRDSDGALMSPVSLAVDELRREILVGDYGNPAPNWENCSFCGAAAPARILIYDYGGELLFEIRGDRSTHWSSGFARVQGMAASTDGRIFAADPLGGRILVFDRYSGALLQELGTQGPDEGQLMLPLDVWLDNETGDLFISNNRGVRGVEVLRGVGGQP